MWINKRIMVWSALQIHCCRKITSTTFVKYLQRDHILVLVLRLFFNLTIVTFYIPSERLCNVEQKLPNKFIWKSVSFWIITTNLRVPVVNKLYFPKKKSNLLKDFSPNLVKSSLYMCDHQFPFSFQCYQQILRKNNQKR